MLSVSPYIGEWIEIIYHYQNHKSIQKVSPYIGEWIEIFNSSGNIALLLVSPYIGEWIEIDFNNGID